MSCGCRSIGISKRNTLSYADLKVVGLLSRSESQARKRRDLEMGIRSGRYDECEMSAGNAGIRYDERAAATTMNNRPTSKTVMADACVSCFACSI